MNTTKLFVKGITLFCLIAGYIILSACSNSSDKSDIIPDKQEPLVHIDEQVNLSDTQIDPAGQQLTNIIEAYLLTLVNSAQELNDKVIFFAKSPSVERLDAAIDALNLTHNLYVGGDFLRTCCFFGTAKASLSESQEITLTLDERLDQYPILPGYLDTVEGYPLSGLIHTDIPITEERMEQEFKLGDPNYVTLGFHALEVILKGDSIKRTVSDFKALSSTDDTSTAPPELRRSLYAILLSSEINHDISKLKLKWSTNLQSKITLQSEEQANKLFSQLNLNANKELKISQDKLQKLASSNTTYMHTNSAILKEREKLLKELLSTQKASKQEAPEQK